MTTLKPDWTDWDGTGSPTPGVNKIPAATFNQIPIELNRSPRVVLFNGTTWPARSTASTVTFFVGGTTAPTDMIDGDVWLPVDDATNVTTDGVQTLTNKTLTNPQIANIVSTGAVQNNGVNIASISGSQTLTNKTIDGPTNSIRNVTGMPTVVRVAAEAGLTYTIASGTVTQINGTTIDGITVAVGDRILIIGAPAATGAGASNTDQPGNGIYVVTAVATNISVARSTDMSGGAMPYGMQVCVRDGTVWGGWNIYFDPGTGLNSFTWGTTALHYAFWTNPGQIVIRDGTQILTNKRINPRVTTLNAPGATPTVATGSFDQINYTGLAAAITSMTTGITGTPVDGQHLILRFKDNGTARTIAWGTSYVSSGTSTLLATTSINKTHLVELLYDSAATKWVCIRVDATGY